MIIVTDIDGTDWQVPLARTLGGAIIAPMRADTEADWTENALGAGILVQNDYGRTVWRKHISGSTPWAEILSYKDETDPETGETVRVPDQVDTRHHINVVMDRLLVGDPVEWVWVGEGDAARELPRYQHDGDPDAWEAWAIFYAEHGGPVADPNATEGGVTLGTITLLDSETFTSPTNKLAGA